jgi:hypothetical protein
MPAAACHQHHLSRAAGFLAALRALDLDDLDRVPRNAWHSAVSLGFPPRQRPIAPSPSHTSTRGTAPSAPISCHQPANRSAAARVGISRPDSHREYPVTIVSTGS